MGQVSPTRPAVTETLRVVTPEEATWVTTAIPKGSRATLLDGKFPEGPSTILVSVPVESRYPLMWHSHPEKMFVVQGEFYGILEGGKETRLSPGSYWYIPAGTIHTARCGNQGPCMFIEIRDKAFDINYVESTAEKK